MFLLKNDKGTQVFTKNGQGNSQFYKVRYESVVLDKFNGVNNPVNYGGKRGMTKTVINVGSDGTTTNTTKVNDTIDPKINNYEKNNFV